MQEMILSNQDLTKHSQLLEQDNLLLKVCEYGVSCSFFFNVSFRFLGKSAKYSGTVG
jgi:hypothetical protein